MPIDMQIKVITRGLNTSEIYGPNKVHLTMTFNLLSVILTVMVGVSKLLLCGVQIISCLICGTCYKMPKLGNKS